MDIHWLVYNTFLYNSNNVYMVKSNSSLARYLTKNKENILLIVVLFLALLTFFSIMGISFKDENKDAPVYLKKHLVVETMQNHNDKHETSHKVIAQKTGPTYTHPESERHTDRTEHPEKHHKKCSKHSDNKTECLNTPGCGWQKAFHKNEHNHIHGLHGSCVLNDITTKRHCNQPLYKEDHHHICHYETKTSDHPSCHKSECDEHAKRYNVKPSGNNDNKFESQPTNTPAD